jgi:hypothetical protein
MTTYSKSLPTTYQTVGKGAISKIEKKAIRKAIREDMITEEILRWIAATDGRWNYYKDQMREELKKPSLQAAVELAEQSDDPYLTFLAAVGAETEGKGDGYGFGEENEGLAD